MSKKKHGNTIPTAPKPPHHHSGGGSTHTSTPSTSTHHTGSGGHSSGGGGGGAGSDPYAYARQQQATADHRAHQQHMDAARTLQQQIDALRAALNGGFKHALKGHLGNIDLAERQQDKVLLSGYHQRVGSLAGAEDDNEKAADAQTFANLGNRGRERMQALSEAFANGAGESDVMRAQEASLRNWNANQSEVNRSYFDSLRSINSSLRDLNVDTKTARVNNVMQSNADREQQWTNYYNQQSETYTQLGNTLGQQAQELAQAALYGSGGGNGGGRHGGGHKKKGGGHVGTGTGGGDNGGGGHGKQSVLGGPPIFRPQADAPLLRATPDGGGGNGGGGGHHRGGGGQPDPGGSRRHGGNRGGGWHLDRGPTPQAPGQDAANAASRRAFMNASEFESKSWDSPGVDKKLMQWKGHRDFEGALNNDNRGAMVTTTAMKRPEGATLRSW